MNIKKYLTLENIALTITIIGGGGAIAYAIYDWYTKKRAREQLSKDSYFPPANTAVWERPQD